MNPNIVLGVSAVLLGAGVLVWYTLSDVYNSGEHTTMESLCAEVPEDNYEVQYFCKGLLEANPDMQLDAQIGCGSQDDDEEPAYFTLKEIFEADDIEAKLEEVGTRCVGDESRRQLLAADYGWCSTDVLSRVVSSEDNANYCNSYQQCTWTGCGSSSRERSLQHCCKWHDECLTLGKESNGEQKKYPASVSWTDSLKITTNWNNLKNGGTETSIGRCNGGLSGKGKCTNECDKVAGKCAYDTSGWYQCDSWWGKAIYCYDFKFGWAAGLTSALYLKGSFSGSC
jgi:hypothetical protein